MNDMKKKFITKTKVIVGTAILAVSVLGIVAYAAADRFLIEHVQVDLNTVSAFAGNSAAGESGGSGTETSGESGDTDYTATGLSYESDSKSIGITKVVTGSGSNQVVYFVADVQLKKATDLKSAFAKNEFGTNIVEYTSAIAEDNNAVFAVNGDYYGFRNNGVIIRNGVLYRNSPAREGLAFYKDGTMKVYDETAVPADELLADGVWNTLSFGPALLDNGNVVSGIEDVEVDTNFGNHSIQGNQPRTGIGIISANHFVFIVVDGRSAVYSVGVTMTQFAQIFKELGCTAAYNIDGGGSSEMYFMGKVVNNPLGKGQERGTSDILYIS